jgi:hypothetical protein
MAETNLYNKTLLSPGVHVKEYCCKVVGTVCKTVITLNIRGLWISSGYFCTTSSTLSLLGVLLRQNTKIFPESLCKARGV